MVDCWWYQTVNWKLFIHYFKFVTIFSKFCCSFNNIWWYFWIVCFEFFAGDIQIDLENRGQVTIKTYFIHFTLSDEKFARNFYSYLDLLKPNTYLRINLKRKETVLTRSKEEVYKFVPCIFEILYWWSLQIFYSNKCNFKIIKKIEIIAFFNSSSIK